MRSYTPSAAAGEQLQASDLGSNVSKITPQYNLYLPKSLQSNLIGGFCLSGRDLIMLTP